MPRAYELRRRNLTHADIHALARTQALFGPKTATIVLGMTDFASWVAQQLADKGYKTDAEAARHIGVPQSTIGRWKTGKKQPLAETMRKISESLGIPMQQVLVAAGYLKPEETGVVEVVSTERLTNEQLVAELSARLTDDNPHQLTKQDQSPEVDNSQDDYVLARMEGETEEQYRRRTEVAPEDQSQGEAPEWGA